MSFDPLGFIFTLSFYGGLKGGGLLPCLYFEGGKEWWYLVLLVLGAMAF